MLAPLLILALGVPGGAQAESPAGPKVIDGLTVELPAGTTWTELEKTPDEARYRLTLEGSQVLLAFAAASIESFTDEKDFLHFAEAHQEQEVSNLKGISRHYNWTHRKGVAYVDYDGIFEEKGASAQAFLVLRGRLCRHPLAIDRMIKMELSQRAGTREEAYKVDLAPLADETFSHLQFTKPDATHRN